MRNIFAMALLVLVPVALVSAAVAQPAQPAQPAQRPAIDWEKQKAAIREHYRALGQIDTTYGNETMVVEYLKKVLEGEGIPSKTFAKDLNRSNLVARLKGHASTLPLLI